MVATPERIAIITQQFRSVAASDSAVKTAYGEAARDTKDEPFETFFDDPDDAQLLANERLTLLKGNRRRFRHDVSGILSFTGDLDFTQTTPSAEVIDEERSADHDAAIVEIAIRFDDEKTSLVTWG